MDLDPGRDLFKQPVTVEEVLDTIDSRIRRRLTQSPHPVYRSLAEQIDRLRQQAIRKAEDSVDFLRQALEVARLAVQAERMEVEGTLDQAEHLLDPHYGALTQIVDQYKPVGTPVISRVAAPPCWRCCPAGCHHPARGPKPFGQVCD